MFPPGVPLRLPDGFPELPRNIFSQFGFKVFTLRLKDGAEVRGWTVATEEDYRIREAKIRNIRPEDVVLSPCAEAGSLCQFANGGCVGDCPSTQFCVPTVDVGGGTIGCHCED
jgi:hypothetical protein